MGVKSYVPIKIKRILNINYQLRQRRKVMHEKKLKEGFKFFLKGITKTKILILDACDHKNLGDQAILMAEVKFLKDNFPKYEVVTLGLNKFNQYINMVVKYINTSDVLVLHGGGNLGNEYQMAESVRREIIKRFPENKIILFPQTMYFHKTNEGKRELENSVEIYSKHKNLTMIARESTSYELMQKNFKHNQILITPDIVFYLNKSLSKAPSKREGALLCCRDDKEGLLDESDKLTLKKYLSEKFTTVSHTDTIGESNFEAVDKKFDEFKKAELVITDRLHGMVFAAITETPCIALSNYNYKVSGTYDWINHLDYIKFTHDISSVPILIENFKASQTIPQFNNNFALKHYKKIITAISQ
ncbi:polysaccharide pyruvyl transferase [Sutcliffiella horikoshii]|uniref:Polysaccharide pyruvyl transferase n=1 Tax=Sutcliffiella horikoshii TaxID=79883 RepID=A0AA94WPS6_9BACI|nr:polysaccharide pyruvyl transferase family protein [Sutcliffiella horikoshii]TYS60083.1 polysaccharide pyruvyl transferase [Sutcliffiella horikoshii]